MGVSINGENAIVDKFKRRKVSATRDFPKGCGRFAAKRDFVYGCGNNNPVVSAGCTQNLKVGAESVIESGNLEVGSKVPESIESVHLPKGLESETLKPVEALNEGERMEDVGPSVRDISKAVDQTELVSPSKSSVSVKDLDRSQSTDVLKISSKTEEKDISSGLLPQATMDSVMADASVPSNAPDEPETLLSNVGSISKQYPPRRRISAIRDFPPGCGRNAPLLSQKERLKLAPIQNQCVENESSGGEKGQPEQMVKAGAGEIKENAQDEDALRSKLKRSVMKDFVENVRVKSDRDVLKAKTDKFQVRAVGESSKLKEENTTRSPTTSSLPRPDMKSLAVSKRVDTENADSGMKLGKESLKINRDISSKRRSPENSEDASLAKNLSQGEVSIGLEPSNERMIVQALMAAPNCPWRQAKRGFKTPTEEATRSKVKKQESMVHAREKVVAENYEIKSTDGKGAYQDSNLLIISDEEEDSSGYDEGDEEPSLVRSTQNLSVDMIPFGLHTLVNKGDNNEAVTRKQVRETLRFFQQTFRKLLREEEATMKQQGTTPKRIDLLSAKILKEHNKYVNTGKQILGVVPGVEVGDEFHYRVELTIIGLHRQMQGGIDYLKKDNGRVVATSIVASGGYSDDMDSSDVLTYSGQGGNPVRGDKQAKQAEDQKLERGNLSLKNSMEDKSPVRVIRGFKETKGSDSIDKKGKTVATYTYDGLYLVEKFWNEKGRYGNNVFMFRLRRIPGQPELAWKELKKSKKLRVRQGLCVDDISHGQEKMPICAINTIDNEKPPSFKYVTKMIYPSCYNLTPPKGCECTDGCSDSEKCLCAVRNGGEIPFNYNGAIVEAKPLVFECGPSCKCPPSCHNRVSQHGIKFQLEIFKTESRGWGVRSLTSIPSGSFICEYTGELLEDKEAEQRTGNDEYLFDIGNNYNDQTLWDGLSNPILPNLQSSFSCQTMEDVGFTIDAAEYGNVGRFINHSCSPNLYAQNVLYDHDDMRMPHIMLFAAENIPPLQELTYHYNYVVDQVRDSVGNIKKKNCYCGSIECTGRLY